MRANPRTGAVAAGSAARSATRSAVRGVTRASGWAERTLPLRVWNRLSQVRGTVLVKGIAYSAFFSIFPILAIGFTAFGIVLRSRPELQDALLSFLVAYLQENLPGVVRADPADPRGLVYPPALVADVTAEGLLTITGAVGLVTLAWGALGWVSALRLGIRAAMHLPVADFHPVLAKLRDLAIALLLGGTVVVTAVATVVLYGATNGLLDLLRLPPGLDDQAAVRVVAFLPIAALDAVLFYLQYRLLAAATLPRRYLLRGAIAAAVAYGLLKLLAGDLLPRLLADSVLAVSFSVLALLVWLNLVARVTLLAAAWAGLMAEEASQAQEPAPEASETTP